MARYRVLFPSVLAVLLLASAAAAHPTLVNLSILEQNERLVVRAASVEGYAVERARFELELDGPGGRVEQVMSEAGGGEYHMPLPGLTPGEYRLAVRDLTFRNEVSQVETTVAWPLAGPLELVLPPGQRASSAGSGLLLLALGVPALAAAGLLAWAFLRRPRGAPARDTEPATAGEPS